MPHVLGFRYDPISFQIPFRYCRFVLVLSGVSGPLASLVPAEPFDGDFTHVCTALIAWGLGGAAAFVAWRKPLSEYILVWAHQSFRIVAIIYHVCLSSCFRSSTQNVSALSDIGFQVSTVKQSTHGDQTTSLAFYPLVPTEALLDLILNTLAHPTVMYALVIIALRPRRDKVIEDVKRYFLPNRMTCITYIFLYSASTVAKAYVVISGLPPNQAK